MLYKMSVRLSVRLSVSYTRLLWQKGLNVSPINRMSYLEKFLAVPFYVTENLARKLRSFYRAAF